MKGREAPVRAYRIPATREASVSSIPGVEARGVRKRYESEGAPVRALRGVDLAVAMGEFVAVMGPRAAGSPRC